MKIYHFSGAGNDFVVLDGRTEDMAPLREVARIQVLCRAYRTDGLMILGDGRAVAPETDFTMEFYNPDGSGGMMCGNGGRCIVAFASLLGIQPGAGRRYYHFLAPDGMHTGEILSHPAADRWQVRIGMMDVHGITPMLGGYFLNTGTRHFVQFVDDVETVDVEQEGKALRWNPSFAPEGTNVNFVQAAPDGLHVRTFEKGVEGETLACGTGLTASALAAWHAGRVISPAGRRGGIREKVHVDLRARQDWLAVEFVPTGRDAFTDIDLIGPATLYPVG
ncbi:MAG: diaminopimelate epimerase [Bacteroidales bacterium]|nr:diaminopimelate epimerase [Bacteroidales bacterium]